MSTIYDTKELRAENLQLDNILDGEYVGPVQSLLDKIENTDVPNYIKIEFQKGFGKTHAAMRYLADNYDDFSHIIFKDSGKFEIINYSKIDDTFSVGRRILKNLDEIDKIDNDAVIFDDIHYIFESFLDGELEKNEVTDYLNKINESKEKRTTIAITDTLLNNYLTPGEFTEYLGSEVCDFFREFNDITSGELIKQDTYLNKTRRSHDNFVSELYEELYNISDVIPPRNYVPEGMEEVNHMTIDLCNSIFDSDSNLLEKCNKFRDYVNRLSEFNAVYRELSAEESDLIYEKVISKGEEYIEERKNTNPFFNFVDARNIQFKDTSLFQKLIQYAPTLNIRELKRLSNKIENKSLEDILHDSLFVNQESSMDTIEHFENRFEISKKIGYTPFKKERNKIRGEVSDLYGEIQRHKKRMNEFNHAIKLLGESQDDWRKREEIKSKLDYWTQKRLESVSQYKMNEEFVAGINEELDEGINVLKTKLIDHDIYGGSLSEKGRYKKIDKYIAGLEKPALPDKDTLWQIVYELENRTPITIEDSKYLPVDDFLLKLLLHDIEEPMFTSDWSDIRERFAKLVNQ
jgi:hypothetical protein